MSNEVYPATAREILHVIPEWRTVVEEYSGGQEQRDQRWLAPRFAFEIEDEPFNLSETWRPLVAFYMRHRGRYESFLFQDWTTLLDYGALGTRTGEDLGKGNGSQTIFYLYENKIDAAAIYKDAVLQTQPAQVTVDLATGKVTFVAAPGSGAKITADVVNGFFRVRFDMDDPDWERIRRVGWRGQIRLQQVPRVTG